VTAATPLPILHFSDMYCPWAYIADIRFEEVKASFGGRVAFSYHFISVYGDIERRIARSGRTRDEYADRVQSLAKGFDHATFHPDLFRRKGSASSMPLHLFLRAVKLLEDQGGVEPRDGDSMLVHAMKAARVAFFRDLVDTSDRREQALLAERLVLPAGELFALIDSGQAHAELAEDLDLQKRHNIAMSPALVLNEGRQVLNGNVGYRVIEANVRELLRNAAPGASWC
jgi:predicted DsbA family dithiol-disulfide isomerase